MTTATITSKGRITIPAQVRQAFSISAGDRVEFVRIDANRFLVRAVKCSVTELKGMFAGSSRKA